MTDDRKMVPQLALSIEADFPEKTWTFRLAENMLVSAGMFYIVPQEQFDAMQRAIALATREP